MKKEEKKENKQGGKNKCNFVLLFPHTSSITQVCERARERERKNEREREKERENQKQKKILLKREREKKEIAVE